MTSEPTERDDAGSAATDGDAHDDARDDDRPFIPDADEGETGADGFSRDEPVHKGEDELP